MKKLNRKLIPAFAMLLLSAVLMSTASFAWFSANGTVDASGLSITATAPAALWIRNQTDDWDVTATFANAKTGISPVTDDITSTANLAAAADKWTFYSLNAAGRAAIGSDGLIGGQKVTSEKATINGTETVIAAKDTDNFIQQKFQLRLEGKKGATAELTDLVGIKVNVKITTTADDIDTIWKALRVAVVCTATATEATDDTAATYSEGGYAIFTPGEDAVLSKSVPLTLTSPVESSRTEKDKDDNDVKSAEFLTIAAQEIVDVYVYVWYEGNDPDCTNDDSQFNIPYAISLQFFSETITANNK